MIICNSYKDNILNTFKQIITFMLLKTIGLNSSDMIKIFYTNKYYS